MKYGISTDIGHKRRENQDNAKISIGKTKGCRAFAIVADGMGGHRAGMLASKIAVDVVSGELESTPDIVEVIHLRNAISLANTAIFEHAQTNADSEGMGTTLVCAVIKEDEVLIANIGDSRAYFFENGTDEILKITRDHSLVAELLASGAIDKNKVKNYPFKHVITRSLGTGVKVNTDIFDIQWNEGDIIMLCSDGLTEYVEDHELGEIISRFDDMEKLCFTLTKLALDRGGNDNITIVAMQNENGGENIGRQEPN